MNYFPLNYSSLVKRKLLQGTAGWTDETLLKSKKFYPNQIKTSIERLKYYSKYFPFVEVSTQPNIN